MATSVHERELPGARDWSPEFFDRLSQTDEDTAEAVDDLLRTVHDARRSKPAKSADRN